MSPDLLAPTPAHNTTPALDHIQSTINANLKTAKQSGRASLEAFRSIGAGLNEAKEILPAKEFGDWCEPRFTFSRAWRAPLMRLAAEWRDVALALTWAEQQQSYAQGDKDVSVNGALRLLTEYRRAMSPPPSDTSECKLGYTSAAESGPKRGSLRSRLEDATRALDNTRRQLAEALAAVERLERHVSSLDAQGASTEAPKPDPKSVTEDGPSAALNSAIKARATLVHSLWTKGSTPGERDTAKARLEAQAQKTGVSFADFLAACGLPAADARPSSAKVDPATKQRAHKVYAIWAKGSTEGERDAGKARLQEMAGRLGMPFVDFLAASGLSPVAAPVHV
jgi:hypothetical protein